ncbi:excalibur calcium-binding domain-containing protein [Actinomadura roseirufa]|uniref:excalibur calcium-binding domain-containing protein n=1 Tax=Actinomadura roseirufa TaxID=2094049 RepID=UPI001040F8AB|nr:excalibur calcium-binding domain-containing protein [Actinomadura roseirufa]
MDRPRTALGILFAGACLLTACGTGTDGASTPRATVTVTETETETETPEPSLTTPEPALPTSEPEPTPSDEPTEKPKLTSPDTDPRYRTCAEAKSHGLGPYTRGIDPEYNWYIDRDHDGSVCE